MRILLVEDEEYMAQAVAQVLEKNNYTVDLAYDGEYGLDCARSGIYDIVILDITISLGEIVLDSSEGSDEVAYVDENGNQEIRPRDDNAFAGETTMTIVVPIPEDGAGDSAEGSTGNAPAEQLPIEFTGEVLEFTIPAGAKITNAMGNEVSFDNVTKGSLVQLIVNETTGVVERLMVM